MGLKSMELILEAICVGLVYVSDCEGDKAFKPGVVRGQVALIKQAIVEAESMLTASASPAGTDRSAEPAETPSDPSP